MRREGSTKNTKGTKGGRPANHTDDANESFCYSRYPGDSRAKHFRSLREASDSPACRKPVEPVCFVSFVDPLLLRPCRLTFFVDPFRCGSAAPAPIQQAERWLISDILTNPGWQTVHLR